MLAEGWYIDRSVSAFVGGPGTTAFDALAQGDAKVIDGAVDAVGAGSTGLGQVLRNAQSGLVRRYAGFVGVGGVLILAWMLTRAVV